MWKTVGQIIKESLQDNATGRYSSTRVIALLVAVASTVFMWKLVIVGGMTIEYFLAYLAYGTGTSGLNKFLDNRDTARIAQSKANIDADKKTADRADDAEDEASLKPPKG